MDVVSKSRAYININGKHWTFSKSHPDLLESVISVIKFRAKLLHYFKKKEPVNWLTLAITKTSVFWRIFFLTQTFQSFSLNLHSVKIPAFQPKKAFPKETMDDITSLKPGVMSRKTSGKLLSETIIFTHFPTVTGETVHSQ